MLFLTKTNVSNQTLILVQFQEKKCNRITRRMVGTSDDHERDGSGKSGAAGKPAWSKDGER